MLALFGLRGVMLSGCAAYPAGFTCIPSLPWAVLPIQARWDDLCVRAWGRNAGDPNFALVLASWDWFPRWREMFVQDPQVQFAVVGIALGLLFAVITRRADKAFLQAAIVLFAALGFWFWASPGVRYGQCFIISAGILGFAVMQPTRWISPVALALALAWAGWNYTPASIQITEVEAYQIEPATGVGVWMPKRPEQCWNHPVPCAANFEQSEITRIHWRIPVPFRKDNPAPKDFEVIPPYRLNPLKE